MTVGSDVETIAKGLTDEQREAILHLAGDVKPSSEIDHEAGVTLFDAGLISSILAAGHHFTNLTDVGLEVHAFLASKEQG